MIKKLIIVVLILITTQVANAQMVAVKSDILKWGAMVPNLGLELVVGNKTTLGVDVFGTNNVWWTEHAELIAISPNYKFWFSGRPLTRQFVGLSAQLANYSIHYGKECYQGNSAAVGVIGGHIFNLSSRWNLELSGGLSLLAYEQKQYLKGDNYELYGERSNSWGTMLFPWLEVSLSYIIN